MENRMKAMYHIVLPKTGRADDERNAENVNQQHLNDNFSTLIKEIIKLWDSSDKGFDSLAARLSSDEQIYITAEDAEGIAVYQIENSAIIAALPGNIMLQTQRVLAGLTGFTPTQQETATIQQTADAITQTVAKKVGDDEIISKINQSAEQVQIQAAKISLIGYITANNGFSIDQNGYVTMNGATVNGSLTSTYGNTQARVVGGWLRFTNNGYEIARMGYYAGSNGGGGYILVTDDYGRERVTMEGEPGCLAVHDTSGNITTRIYTHQYATYFLDLAYHIASHMGNDTTRSYMTLNSPAGTTDIFLDTLNGCRIGTSFTVTGTKSRAADAGEYGERLLYCYETPTPMFGDVGEGVLDETGTAYIVLDPVLAETVNSAGYQVFLQKYGAGDIYVAERKGPYFVVNGTPGLAFGWELKAKQKDFDQLRLEQYVEPENEEEPDYGGMAAEYIQELYNGRITE